MKLQKIDGANSRQKFWYVTIPMLSPTIFFNVVLGIIGALQVFDAGWVTTRGGPNDATLALHAISVSTCFPICSDGICFGSRLDTFYHNYDNHLIGYTFLSLVGLL